MKTLIKRRYFIVRSNKRSLAYLSAFYDKYAGALYGIILRIVGNDVVAVKVLEETFKAHFLEDMKKEPTLVSEFTSISNRARKKALNTLKAIKMFETCNHSRKCVAC